MDPDQVARLWSQHGPDRYRVSASTVAFNTVDSELLVEAACELTDSGFVLVKQSAPKFGVAGRAYVSAAFGSDLSAALARTKQTLVELGFTSWQFGGDVRHFFPGVPHEARELAKALESVGMTKSGDEVVDLERDLADYDPPFPPAAGARPCTPSDRAALARFLESEFPGRWHHDVLEKFDESPARIIGLFDGDLCIGMAMTQGEGDKHVRAGAVWHLDLGPHWGALGPIGVAKTTRGQGLGHALLATALLELKKQGTRRTIIDWTTLVEFYGRHGFVPTRRYTSYMGELA